MTHKICKVVLFASGLLLLEKSGKLFLFSAFGFADDLAYNEYMILILISLSYVIAGILAICIAFDPASFNPTFLYAGLATSLTASIYHYLISQNCHQVTVNSPPFLFLSCISDLLPYFGIVATLMSFGLWATRLTND